MRSEIKRKLNLICEQNFFYYFIKSYSLRYFPYFDLFNNITSPFISIRVHDSLCIIIVVIARTPQLYLYSHICKLPQITVKIMILSRYRYLCRYHFQVIVTDGDTPLMIAYPPSPCLRKR